MGDAEIYDTGVAQMRHAQFIWYGSEALDAPRPAAGAKTRGGRKEALPPKNGRCVHFSSMPVLECLPRNKKCISFSRETMGKLSKYVKSMNVMITELAYILHFVVFIKKAF